MKKTKAKRAAAPQAHDSGAPAFVKEWLSGRGCGPRCRYGKPTFCTAAVEVILYDFAAHLWLNPNQYRSLVERKKGRGTVAAAAEVARRILSVEAPAAPLSRGREGKGR